MLAHRIETIVREDRTVILDNLPFHSGERVEIIVLSQPHPVSQRNRYPLRGTPIQYIAPTEPVSQDDWEVAQ